MPEVGQPKENRPPTPLRTSWFEFLLDDTLLEKHLCSEKPGITIFKLD